MGTCIVQDCDGVSAPSVSVVIPLYYAEEYIDGLLAQLLSQPLEDIEIICVVDGSPDATLDIVKEHARQDARVKWLYQENAGAGMARNAGIAIARGDYLSFIDADDLYDASFLSKMHGAAKRHDADLVVCQFKRTDYDSGEEWVDQGFRSDRVPSGTLFAPETLAKPFSDISSGPTNKLFRRVMVERGRYGFSATHAANDVFFVFASIAASRRILAIPDSLIQVRRYVNPHSISSNRGRYTEDAFKGLQELSDWLIGHGLWDRYKGPYAAAWAAALHYNARYERNQKFVEAAAQALASAEPWCHMGDAELMRSAHLDTSVIDAKRFVAARLKNSRVRGVELERLSNEKSALVDVASLLNTEYGKNLPVQSSIIRGFAAYLKDNGMRHSAAKAVGRLRQKRPRR